ncbi:YjcZ family sporulation protein OS=Lysinibacillus sphaericus OT4b.31 OX=1285586 GN=H131_05813 PE=3 SV=1 [Lysinibacillus sphaericus]
MGYQGWCAQPYGNNVAGANSWNYCGGNNNNGTGLTFVLIVVLFILLIIVGATFVS